MIRRLIAVLLLQALAWAGPAFAVNPNEILADPALEGRARHISTELRCLVCQNQSIDDSNADLAHDLRVLVRERLQAGDSDEQVVAYLRARYGDFVLLRPPVERATWVLWFGPPLVLAVLAGATIAIGRRKRASAPSPLTEAEQRRLAEILGEDVP